MSQPTVGRIVHYADDRVDGAPVCRAAIVTELGPTDDTVSLMVMLPKAPEPHSVVCQGAPDAPGKWHWPERTPEAPASVS